MAIANFKTHLPLDRWAEIIGLDPRHFNQIVTAAKQAVTCDKVWKQHPWQENDQVSREDVAQAIQQAEKTLERYLGYRLLPCWEQDERIDTPQPGDRALFYRNSQNMRGYPLHVQTKWGHFISGGMEAKTLIDTPAVVYSDADLDGYPETATITFNTAVTEPSELAIYFSGNNGDDEFEIRPFRSITIAAGVATVKLWRHQLVNPELWEALEPEQVDGDDDGNFAAEVDVYRHYNDPSQQVQLVWSPNGANCEDACCENSYQWGCLNAKENRLGLVYYKPGSWNETTESFDSAELSVCRNPDRLRMWYYSGLRDGRRKYPCLQMEPSLERAVAYYSLTLLDRPICGCNNLEKVVNKWTDDLGLQTTTTESSTRYELSQRLIDNPLGTTRGAIFAWETVSRMQSGRAVRY